MKWIHQKAARKKFAKSVASKFNENEDVTKAKRITIDTEPRTKRCNEIRFQQFQVSTVAAAFLCLIDTCYNNSLFEGENKVISRFITIEIQRTKRPGREMNAGAIFNNIFSVHHV